MRTRNRKRTRDGKKERKREIEKQAQRCMHVVEMP